MSTGAAQQNNPCPQSALIKKLFQDLRPYNKYLRELYKTLNNLGLLSEEGHDELTNWVEKLINDLSHDLSPRTFGRIANAIKAQYIKVLTEAHYTLLSAYKTPFLKIHAPHTLPGNLPKPLRTVVKDYVQNYDAIEDFFAVFETNYKKRCRQDFKAPNGYIKILNAEEDKAKQYYDTLENVYSGIIEDSKLTRQDKNWDRTKTRLEVGQILGAAVIATVAFAAGHFLTKKFQQHDQTQQPVNNIQTSDSTISTNITDTISKKKTTPSAFIYRTQKMHRFVKATIQCSVVNMFDWCPQIFHSLAGYHPKDTIL